MKEYEIKKYKQLNELAEPYGTVIFGGSEDLAIPLCELKQAFALKGNYYNRSFEALSISDAADIYASCIANLYPETVLLHIGNADVEMFSKSPEKFSDKYRKLISQIRKDNKQCTIAVVSLKNYDNDSDIAEVNKHIKYIADSEMCEYCDISDKRVCSLKQTKDVISFVYDIGFVRPLKSRRPLNELVKILF